MNELTQEYVRECFEYNPDTGELRWKSRPRKHFKSEGSCKSFNAKWPGKVAGNIHKYTSTSYMDVKLNNVMIKQHRLIMLLVNGSLPEEVDHINGNGLDNRWCNLRAVTRAENAKNHRRRKDNTSGITGIRNRNGKWHVRINSPTGKRLSKTFIDKFEAICWKKSMENLFNFHSNHGTKRGVYG